MKINSISSQAFKSIYYIQIPKEAFKNPENVSATSYQFKNNIADCRLKDMSLFQRMFAWIAPKITKMKPIYVCQESPGYELMKKACKYYDYNYPISWVEANSHTNLTHPADEKRISFYVLTGDEGVESTNKLEDADVEKLYKESGKEIEPTDDPSLNGIRLCAVAAELADDKFYKIIEGKPVINMVSYGTPVNFENILNQIDFNA